MCTPNAFHASQTIDALRQGYHVLCEKPMSLHSKDAEEMIQLAREQHRLLMIVKQNRFNTPMVQLKQWIETGQSGKLYSFSLNCLWNRNKDYFQSSPWHGTTEIDGGILYTQFSHYIDFCIWLFGDIQAVQSFQSNAAHVGITAFDDQGVALLKFESGLIGTLHFSINSFEKNMESSLTLLAEHGSIKIGGSACNEMEYQHKSGEPFSKMQTAIPVNEYGKYRGSASNHHLVYDHFIQCLLHNDKNEKSLHEAKKTIELIERIYATANTTVLAD